MEIAIIKEIAAAGRETRTILLPREVKRLTDEGHRVFAEKGVGERIYISDSEYVNHGARLIANRRELFRKEIVVKLKPPLPTEFKLLRKNLLFCMLHAEQNPQYVRMLRQAGSKAIAMELIKNRAGERLVSCCDMAGEQGMIMAFHLAKKSPADCHILLLGYGSVASGALKVAFNLGAKVKILRKSEYKYIRHFLRNKDIVVNAICWPKEKRDRREYLITKGMLCLMNKGGIILDLSVDYPSPIETCHPTLINRPIYEECEITHISIFGYPGLAPISSASRYSRQILPILSKIASIPLERLPLYLKKALIF
jgi:alanine dehydrogenase